MATSSHPSLTMGSCQTLWGLGADTQFPETRCRFACASVLGRTPDLGLDVAWVSSLSLMAAPQALAT